MEKLRIQLRAVFYREGDQWIAHCLEMDLVGHGATKKEALGLLSSAILTQIHESARHQNTANIFMPADAKLFEMYAAGKDCADGHLTFEPGVTKVLKRERVHGIEMETREYAGALALA